MIGPLAAIDGLVGRLEWRALPPLWRLLLGSHGVEVARSARVVGKPLVSVAAGSSIRIGERVLLVSSPRATALGVSHAVILRTLLAGAQIEIEADSGLSGTTICAATRVSIGRRVLIGSDVVIMDTDFHPVLCVPRRYAPLPQPEPSDGITIEDDVFIGARALILRGVTIGRGSVIGAGSVVRSSIPPRVIAAGVPCTVVRSLPAEDRPAQAAG